MINGAVTAPAASCWRKVRREREGISDVLNRGATFVIVLFIFIRISVRADAARDRPKGPKIRPMVTPTPGGGPAKWHSEDPSPGIGSTVCRSADPSPGLGAMVEQIFRPILTVLGADFTGLTE